MSRGTSGAQPDTPECPLCYTTGKSVCVASCPVGVKYRPETADKTFNTFYKRDNEKIKENLQQVPNTRFKEVYQALEYRFCHLSEHEDVRAFVSVCAKYVRGYLDSLKRDEEARRLIAEQDSHGHGSSGQDNRSQQAVGPAAPSVTQRVSVDLNSVEEPMYVVLLQKGEPSSVRDLLSIADKELLLDINDHLYRTAYSGKRKRTEALSDVFERACRHIIRLKEQKIHYVPYGILAWLACGGRDTIPGHELQNHLTSDDELRNKMGGIPILPTQPILKEDHITRCFNVLGDLAKNQNEIERKEREAKASSARQHRPVQLQPPPSSSGTAQHRPVQQQPPSSSTHQPPLQPARHKYPRSEHARNHPYNRHAANNSHNSSRNHAH